MKTTLSPRELQIAAAVASGERQVDIARRLNLSRKTIYTYTARIREKRADARDDMQQFGTPGEEH